MKTTISLPVMFKVLVENWGIALLIPYHTNLESENNIVTPITDLPIFIFSDAIHIPMSPSS
ncbi:hypothetical protein [Paenibacillus sp. NPDC058177]|uniref:hypothetical protein n=1 Tax=Paenibacillus sp. NPDC058177 TaxID=3346369 RepID=UPI0036D90EFD